MSYLLSLIVPTKNRYKYIDSILDLFMKHLDNGAVQLLIQDNSDDNTDFSKRINGLNNSNIKYCYIQSPLSVTENFDQGILNSDGEYVVMLGDDDIVSTYVLGVTQFLKENDIDSAIFNKGYYKWPDALASIKKFSFAPPVPSLLIRSFSGKVTELSAIDELKKSIKNGGTNLARMPEVYHGMVARRALDLIYKQNGTYFPGPSPDMAIASALSLVVKKHVFIDAPVTCSGQGYVSTGGQGLRKQHKGRLEDMTFLPKDTVEKWEPSIPKIWTPQTIYADSLFKCLESMGHQGLLSEFDYISCYSSIIVQYPEFKELVLDVARKNNVLVKEVKAKCRKLSIRKFGSGPWFYFNKVLGRNRDIYINGIPTAYGAVSYLDGKIDELPGCRWKPKK